MYTVDSEQSWFYAYGLANIAAGGSSILLPLYALHLGADAGGVGLLAAAASVVSIPASILWGNLSDRWKVRKLFIALGFLGISASFVLMALTKSLFWLILVNGFFSLWWIASASLATVMIIEREEKVHWESKIALFNFVVSLGWLMGLVIGFGWSGFSTSLFTKELSFLSLFLLFGFVSSGAFIVSVLLIPEKSKFNIKSIRAPILVRGALTTERFRYLPSRIYFILSPGKLVSTLKKVSPELNYFLVSVVLSFTGFAIFFVPLPVWLKESLELSDDVIFFLFIINALANTIFNNRAGSIIKNLGNTKAVVLSLISRIILFPAIFIPLVFKATTLTIVGIGVVLFLIGISWTVINIGNSVFLANLTSTKLKGQVFGIYNGAIGLSGVFGALMGGFIAKFSGYLGSLICASLLITGGIVFFSKSARPKDKPDQITNNF
ncbi:MFS transporter [Candidatus Bipolaricaulota bacterium]|nr:MFS transporter [Candidatus Bipolaricaulota bacterium]